ncbi:MAG TPA: class I SAM-dependent methyltransferase [Acidimicrobiales bacterium]|nr:class I SAM-dependent methyltransferase [Acidimicrobiales bacterium]
MLTIDLARAGVAPRARTLDLGCGGGRHAFACLRAGAHVVALDASPGEVAQAAAVLAAMCEAGQAGDGAGWSAVTADAARVPFPDASLDCVIAAEVLEHIDDDAAALAELARVLRPGGTLALSVPRFGPELVNWTLSTRYHSVEGGHVRIYRRRQLRRRLEAAGLRPFGSHHAHALHTPYWWLRCLVGVERSDQRLVAAYHRLLVRQIERNPLVLRLLDRLLNPLVGKSLVVYACRTAAPPRAAPPRLAPPRRVPPRPAPPPGLRDGRPEGGAPKVLSGAG